MAHMMTRMTRMTRWLDSHDSLARWLAVCQDPRPAEAIVSGLLSYDDTFLTEGCREKHLAMIIRDKIHRA